MSQYNEYYKYMFKHSNEFSYSCLASKIYKKNNILLGTSCKLLGTSCKLFIPLPFWFCRVSGLALPIGYIGGQPFDLRNNQPKKEQQIQLAVDFKPVNDILVINNNA